MWFPHCRTTFHFSAFEVAGDDLNRHAQSLGWFKCTFADDRVYKSIGAGASMNGEWFPGQPGAGLLDTRKIGRISRHNDLVAVLTIAEHRGGDQSDIGNLSFGRCNQRRHIPHSTDLHLVG